MHARQLAFLLAVVCFGNAFARPFRIWEPEELSEKADVVLIGVVTEVVETGETSTIRLGDRPPLPVKVCRASIRVIERIKGDVSGGITLVFAGLDDAKIGKGKDPVFILNPPDRIWVRTDAMHLMYLKRTESQNAYVGALDGDYDDGQAVKLLSTAPPGAPHR